MERVARFFRLLFLTWVCLSKTTSAKHGKNSLPSAMVEGTVYCDTCFQQQDFSRSSHTISGASVAVECGDTGTEPRFRKEVRTDEHGEFMVELPFRVGKHIRSIKRCTVKLVNSSEPYCSVASSATSSSLHLKSRKQGIHIFSAGFFTFKPLKEPELCYQRPSPQTLSKFTSDQEAFLPFPDPISSSPLQPILPPLLSIQKLPPKISLSATLNPPRDQTNPPAVRTNAMIEKEEESHPDTFFFPSPPFGLPPNPFFPPPLILPPNPLLPSPPFGLPPNPFFPPPSILPPNPLLPSPPPFINIPPIPFFTPPPPPPIIPFFPFPPFPFPPPRPPVFPGIPPANTMNEKSP